VNLNQTHDNLAFQWKYRIEAAESTAARSGVYGKAVAVDVTYNSLVNDQGCRNTNKPGDLKVSYPIVIQNQTEIDT
jgi:hypothetical protein